MVDRGRGLVPKPVWRREFFFKETGGLEFLAHTPPTALIYLGPWIAGRISEIYDDGK